MNKLLLAFVLICLALPVLAQSPDIDIGSVYKEGNKTVCVGRMIVGSNVFVAKKIPVENRIANCGFDAKMAKVIFNTARKKEPKREGCRAQSVCQITVDLNQKSYVEKVYNAFTCADWWISGGNIHCQFE